MARFIHVHGILSKGRESVDRLGRELERRGHQTVNYDYPRVGILHTLVALRAGQKRGLQYDRAKRLAVIANSMHPYNVVAHSFGCLVTLRAMELGAAFKTVYWFAPAMDVDFLLPYWGAEKLVVVHNPNDRAIKLGSMLRRHDFGKMGLHGSAYAKYDDRITNHQAENNDGDNWINHNYAFATPDRVSSWADHIEANAE